MQTDTQTRSSPSPASAPTLGTLGGRLHVVEHPVIAHKVGMLRLKSIWPFPTATVRKLLAGAKKIIVPEMNLGQLALLLRGRFLVDAIGYNQVRGLPFTSDELAGVITNVASSL